MESAWRQSQTDRPSQGPHDLSPPSAHTEPQATLGLHPVSHSRKATPTEGGSKEASGPLVSSPVVSLVEAHGHLHQRHLADGHLGGGGGAGQAGRG